MKRERLLQVVLVLVGLLFTGLIYPLFTDLWHSKWLVEMNNETEPMFLSFFVALGPFLLISARAPTSHRSLIAFAAWSSLAHASVMAIETVEAWNHGVHRDYTDVIVAGVIGGMLLVLSPPRREKSAALTQ